MKEMELVEKIKFYEVIDAKQMKKENQLLLDSENSKKYIQSLASAIKSCKANISDLPTAKPAELILTKEEMKQIEKDFQDTWAKAMITANLKVRALTILHGMPGQN